MTESGSNRGSDSATKRREQAYRNALREMISNLERAVEESERALARARERLAEIESIS